MSLRNKKIKNNFLNELKIISKNFKFKGLNLSFSKQLVLLWTILWFISLFMPWINNWNNSESWNAFNSLTWNIWYLLIFVFILPIFVILSTNYKEKIKLYSDLSLKNHFTIIASGIFIISFSIITLSFINGFNTFVDNTYYWNGIILSMTSWIIILIWWLLIRKEYYTNSSEIILDKLNQDREKAKEKDNMKLPF